MLRNAQSLLLVGAVLGLLVGTGCGHPGQEAVSPVPEEGRPPASPASDSPELPIPADAGVPETPDAGPAPSTPPAPPEIVEASQSVPSVSGGGSVTLRVEARPAQEGAVDFSWQSAAGTLGTPSSTEDSSEVSWTAPSCGVGVSKYTVQVSLRQLSSSEVSQSFEISVVCPQWVATQTPMGMGRYGHTISLLPDSGKVVVVGRYTGDNASSAELYNLADGTWTSLANMSRGRRSHTASVLSGDRVLVTGGYNTLDGILASAELYDPSAPPSQPWTPAGTLEEAGAPSTRRRCCARARCSSRAASERVGRWRRRSCLTRSPGHGPGPVAWAATAAMDTRRPCWTRGRCWWWADVGARGELRARECPIRTGIWTKVASSFTARAHHTATLLGSGQVLVVGGSLADSSRGLVEAELYEPSRTPGRD